MKFAVILDGRSTLQGLPPIPCGDGFIQYLVRDARRFALAITLSVRWGINLAGIAYTPPNQAGSVPLLVDLDVGRIGLTLVMMLLVG